MSVPCPESRDSHLVQWLCKYVYMEALEGREIRAKDLVKKKLVHEGFGDPAFG